MWALNLLIYYAGPVRASIRLPRRSNFVWNNLKVLRISLKPNQNVILAVPGSTNYYNFFWLADCSSALKQYNNEFEGRGGLKWPEFRFKLKIQLFFTIKTAAQDWDHLTFLYGNELRRTRKNLGDPTTLPYHQQGEWQPSPFYGNKIRIL